MTPDPVHQDPALHPVRPPAAESMRRGALVTSIVALAVGVCELLAGGLLWYLTETDPSDDPLVGIGYLFALVVGVPGAIAVVLGALGWALASRVAGLVLAILAAVAAAGPVLVFLAFMVP